MGRYTTARSFDDRSTEIQAAPTEAEKKAASTKDILDVQNTMGSTAGAGSGDFHQYRQSRRRELFRLAKIAADAKREEKEEEFLRRKEERSKEAEDQHKRRAEKRRRKKDKKRKAGKGQKTGGGGAGGGGGGSDSDSNSDDGEAGSKAQRDGADGGGAGADVVEGPQLPAGLGPGPDVYVHGAADQPPPGVKIKEVNNIRIIDDD